MGLDDHPYDPDDDLDVTTAELDLVHACEAYLDGLYVEYLALRGRPVPSWAWLNVVAHCTHTRLQALAASPPSAVRAAAEAHIERWQRALTFMATTALSHAPTEQSFERLQRSVLVPLELELVRGGTESAMNAEQLALRVFSDVHELTGGWMSDAG